jgi:hypothetical protein
VAIKIIKERRRREIEPIIKDLKQLGTFEATNFEEKNFKNVLNSIAENAEKLNSMANMVEQFDKLNFFKWFNAK